MRGVGEGAGLGWSCGQIRKVVYLFIYGCISSLLVRFSLEMVSRATFYLWPLGFSLQCLLSLQSTVSRALVAAAHGHYCPAACRSLLEQGSNPCPLHGQADS